MQTVGSDPVSKSSSENVIIKWRLTQRRTLIGFFQYRWQAITHAAKTVFIALKKQKTNSLKATKLLQQLLKEWKETF